MSLSTNHRKVAHALLDIYEDLTKYNNGLSGMLMDSLSTARTLAKEAKEKVLPVYSKTLKEEALKPKEEFDFLKILFMAAVEFQKAQKLLGRKPISDFSSALLAAWSFILDNRPTDEHSKHNKFVKKAESQSNIRQLETKIDMFHSLNRVPKATQETNDLLLPLIAVGSTKAIQLSVLLKDMYKEIGWEILSVEAVQALNPETPADFEIHLSETKSTPEKLKFNARSPLEIQQKYYEIFWKRAKATLGSSIPEADFKEFADNVISGKRKLKSYSESSEKLTPVDASTESKATASKGAAAEASPGFLSMFSWGSTATATPVSVEAKVQNVHKA